MAIKDLVNKSLDNDKRAFFDFDLNKWVLKLDYANFRSGLDLVELWRSKENAEWYLEAVSHVVYTNIMQYKRLEAVNNFLYELNHSKEKIDALIEVMWDTVMYNEAGGGFLMAYETGINLQEMKELKMSIEQTLSSIAKSIVEKSGLGVRVSNTDISFVKEFDRLEDLLDYLVNKELLILEEATIIESVDEIPYNFRYRCFYDKVFKKFYYKRTGGDNVWHETGIL